MNSIVSKKESNTWFSVFTVTVFLVLIVHLPVYATERFPVYPCIKSHVKFWENVYGRYSTRQGIIHDRDNLGKVYTVIHLVEAKTKNAEQINRQRVELAKEQIRAILLRLGNGLPPRTPEERRIASLFPSNRPAAYHAAQETIRFQLGQSDRFYEGVIRSGKYLPTFRRIFISKGMPSELIYLPHVESSFNPKAYSKAGAAGLWQFTRSTGKEYLTVNELVDERYDPYTATEAAAQLLKDNFNKLHCWPLALTAYNYGRNGTMRAKKEMGTYERIFTSYNQGAFKFASRNFYSEFIAALRVAQQIEKTHKFSLERPEPIITLRLKNDTPVKQIQSYYRLSAEQFSRLNPALLRPVLNGEHAVPGNYLVRLPADKQNSLRLARQRSTVEQSRL
ncbi:lytic transglycosylase domain-containing protein [Desulfobulbus oligotrophicus]|uniref:Lytic transglycosylase domain-containing protein n=1 Tax=Desulfobulbus oligotrophicus TaxID=1909699 RepID=A0A7T6AQB8_9BACT|nr:lytic transglycosylase domain-containing protein [Desulfobulbus oligotrophicus]QQG65558.1 lytic transglycosylase domain-containing protein [Desulfobulbus oligotrophicus]